MEGPILFLSKKNGGWQTFSLNWKFFRKKVEGPIISFSFASISINTFWTLENSRKKHFSFELYKKQIMSSHYSQLSRLDWICWRRSFVNFDIPPRWKKISFLITFGVGYTCIPTLTKMKDCIEKMKKNLHHVTYHENYIIIVFLKLITRLLQ